MMALEYTIRSHLHQRIRHCPHLRLMAADSSVVVVVLASQRALLHHPVESNRRRVVAVQDAVRHRRLHASPQVM